jgi:hypothetical protein
MRKDSSGQGDLSPLLSLPSSAKIKDRTALLTPAERTILLWISQGVLGYSGAFAEGKETIPPPIRRQAMRNMLAFLAAATLTVIAVGWYLDWFKLRNVPASTGHRSWTVDMNTEKIGHDLLEAEHKVKQKLEQKNKPEAATSTDHHAKADAEVKPAEAVKPAVGDALRKLEGIIEQPDR